MKKFGILLMTAFIALTSLSSCNDNSSEFARNSCFAVVYSTGTGLTFQSDDNLMLYVANNRVTGYQGSIGDRVIIGFNFMESETSATNRYAIDLFTVSEVRWGETATVADAEELKTLGEAPVVLYADGMLSATEEILNMAVAYYGTTPDKHKLTLVQNNDPEYAPTTTAEGYLNLELRHNDTEKVNTSGYAEWVSFDLSEFDVWDYKGLIIGMTNFNNEKVYTKVDFTVVENGEEEFRPSTF